MTECDVIGKTSSKQERPDKKMPPESTIQSTPTYVNDSLLLALEVV